MRTGAETLTTLRRAYYAPPPLRHLRRLRERGLIRGCKLRCAITFIGTSLPAISQPVIGCSWDQMEVEMRNRLPGDLTFVKQQIESFRPSHSHHRTSQSRQRGRYFRTFLGWDITETRVVFSGDDEQMTVGQRSDVEES